MGMNFKKSKIDDTTAYLLSTLPGQVEALSLQQNAETEFFDLMATIEGRRTLYMTSLSFHSEAEYLDALPEIEQYLKNNGLWAGEEVRTDSPSM